jgi:hypothetical protein
VRIFGTVLGSVFGLALLLALVAGGYYLFQYVVSVFAGLDPQVETPAAIATVVALLCAVIIAEGARARGQGVERAREIAERTDTYGRLLCLCGQVGRSSERGDRLAADEELVRLEHILALQGSAKVISAYVKFRNHAETGTADSTLLNNLLVEMRKDLGRTERIRDQSDFLNLLSPRR